MSIETKRILDIGVGTGGGYILEDTAGTLRIGVDLELPKLKKMRLAHPNVQAVTASAEKLPFISESFDSVEITLPCKSLLHKGVQDVLDGMTRRGREDGEAWYNEYARVLRPQGTLLIRGDHFVDTNRTIVCASPYFNLLSVRQMSLEEFEGLDTDTTYFLMNAYRTDSFDRFAKEVFPLSLKAILFQKA